MIFKNPTPPFVLGFDDLGLPLPHALCPTVRPLPLPYAREPQGYARLRLRLELPASACIAYIRIYIILHRLQTVYVSSTIIYVNPKYKSYENYYRH